MLWEHNLLRFSCVIFLPIIINEMDLLFPSIKSIQNFFTESLFSLFHIGHFPFTVFSLSLSFLTAFLQFLKFGLKFVDFTCQIHDLLSLRQTFLTLQVLFLCSCLSSISSIFSAQRLGSTPRMQKCL